MTATSKQKVLTATWIGARIRAVVHTPQDSGTTAEQLGVAA